jgi:hypothetical protein
MFAPSVEGYFRRPAIWIGAPPQEVAVYEQSPTVHPESVFDGMASDNLPARIRRDGLFLFDFTSWPNAPMQRIPGYTIEPGKSIPREVIEAETKAEQAATTRAQLMNVHQACIATAEQTVAGRTADIGIPVASSSAVKAWSMMQNPPYFDGSESDRSLAMNISSEFTGVSLTGPSRRRVLEIEVVNESFNLLGQILSVTEEDLLTLIDLLYIAAFRFSERRFNESVVLSWSVSEKLINIAWSQFLAKKNVPVGDRKRIANERRTQLTEGRDFTASVKTEFLELSDLLPFQLYEKLKSARRARNKWVHGLSQLAAQDAHLSVTACQELLHHLFRIKIKLSFSFVGGVPEIPASQYAELSRQREGAGG